MQRPEHSPRTPGRAGSQDGQQHSQVQHSLVRHSQEPGLSTILDVIRFVFRKVTQLPHEGHLEKTSLEIEEAAAVTQRGGERLRTGRNHRI